MQLTRLRLTGFKTFVEPTEFPIEPGLTGIVGPNGCGKSNLVEALRWVMGESSFKNMRGAGMDDVIFGGSGERPARNMAEVALTLDNSDRRAPAAFNETDVLEVTRRIEREEGSTYRVNGKEVRAKDVQLLFADAATGARSPALVRQGQISEIISAKPQSRRRILEDAAGIAGLHSRRHEAELRLRGAEDNLTRLEDVLGEIDGQIEALHRQARQASRYRSLASDIRRAEAVLALLALHEARAQEAQASRALEEAVRLVADATGVQAEAAKMQAIAAHAMPALRDEEAAAAAALVRLKRGLDELEAENRRARQRAEELGKRLAELEADLARQDGIGRDAQESLARLQAEDAALHQEGAQVGNGAEAAALAVRSAEDALAAAEAAHAAAQAALAELSARRGALEQALRSARGREERAALEQDRLKRDRAALDAAGAGTGLGALRTALGEAEAASREAEAQAGAARARLATARDQESRLRVPLAEAERKAQKLETEATTLRKLLAPATEGRWPPILDAIRVARGFEVALGAALGEDLDASADIAAPAHWRETPAANDPALPAGAEPLLLHVEGPAAIRRRLAQTGIVAREAGAAMAPLLEPGQILVSREGDLWRWDGFTSAADAPSPAARRLAETNRLDELARAAEAARALAEAARSTLDAAASATREAAKAEASQIEDARQARQRFDRSREALAQAERKAAETAARLSGLSEAIAAAERAAMEAAGQRREQEAAMTALPVAAALEMTLLEARAALGERRAAASDARARQQTLAREAELRARRQESIAADIAAWTKRAAASLLAASQGRERIAAASAERQALLDSPDTFLSEKRRLTAEIEQAEAGRRAAADRLASGEVALAESDRQARIAFEALSGARETRAAAEARQEAARQRVTDVVRQIEDGLETGVEGLHAIAGTKPGDGLPDADAIERRLAHLKAERERLGAVNLRAEDELVEVKGKREGLATERDDLTEAIRRLRQAIGALNREGRERLTAAFDVVNGHFQRLFGVLFGGGEAELRLVDSEDPLEAGLEIFARPPGKKPQVMTLLSGGEQALTATALIFAVFLTNPSPICVLDEVDAPLDDANVERYCDLLADMARNTSTRFILITHNPITMARMERLFGVTMAERGVSQMVSVDLSTAERIREAV
ncbi:chromosome segregation protein SMC [Bosea sp. (in: a-proteobacteria)]|uniref:chromosome segregation protein SMC n=1 Tax=Bosea sp. (in: a-proteobacteria) TaxID=1871050 RepID=UPI00121D68E8|nr:chromosome segregation protein SMC [Bosea sp. (in: a-proteobacteria)]TAJ29867.1 MAG: chromosome segregation protein SMC [Bosea sp. (in: a-proteobacteria)]